MNIQADKPALLAGIYLNPDYYPPTFNAVNILRRDFRIHLICRNHQAPFRQWPAEVEIRRLGEYGAIEQKKALSPLAKFREYRAFIQAARTAIEEIGPSVIYAWEPFAFAAFCRAGAIRRRIPMIYHLHELPEGDSSAASMQTWVRRYALKRARIADAMVFPEANRAAHYLRAAGDSRPAIVVPNCPARDFLAIAETEIAAMAERRRRSRELIYVGLMAGDHSNLEAVRALEYLPGARLQLIGRAGESFARELRQAAADLNAGERLAMPGSLPHTDFAARASRASIGLAMYKPVSKNLEYIASATNKLFEYAACGLPVIVPDLPNYRDFLCGEEWVAYADPYEPRSIAKAAESLLADRGGYARRSVAARRYFTERYHYERVFEPLLARIRELAGVAEPLEPAARESAR
jgi:glycosyltransferase involved in cell wall biosynthesis